jgi:hypothetical protein
LRTTEFAVTLEIVPLTVSGALAVGAETLSVAAAALCPESELRLHPDAAATTTVDEHKIATLTPLLPIILLNTLPSA